MVGVFIEKVSFESGMELRGVTVMQVKVVMLMMIVMNY